MKVKIVVTFQFEGLHCWPDCPYDDVKYLRAPHRHMFHVKATKTVSHDNRDIEIIRLKHLMQAHLPVDQKLKLVDLGSQSCEMVARGFVELFDLDSCEVLEDGENGAIVENVK